jgi:invasion protein IalB
MIARFVIARLLTARAGGPPLGIPIAALMMLTSPLALAQQSPAPVPPAPAQQVAPRPVAPAKKTPPVQRPQAQKSAPQPAPATQQSATVYTPWTKFCGKETDAADGKDVCVTLKEVRVETGRLIASALLSERAGDEKKVVRITLPLGLQLVPGTRMNIDGNSPVTSEFTVCSANGCSAEYTLDAEFVARLKRGQNLQLQAISMQGQVMNYPLPLEDFAKANEGPASDPVAFETDQKRQWEQRLRNLAAQKK